MSEVGVSWTVFFAAEVGATAALAGLIIVAISINLQRILSAPHLPGRAFEALVLLLGALLICSVALIPAQTPRLLGGEILLVEFPVLLTSIVTQISARKVDIPQMTVSLVARALLVTLTAVPIVIGGIVLISGDAAGLYWVAPGILVAIAASVMNTWVLLVEILR